ncbi:MAG: hypothetical protein OXQ90_17725 [Gammaproteobacteria bacterium]|nr:hypothetical protein [Gammaproteobacteria bacterium]
MSPLHAATTAVEAVLHPRTATGKVWKYLPLVLAVAFLARAAVALCGDFALHPDEIFQYQEPAHRAVFGYGVTYWEYYYGARSWLVPGLIAGVLKVFDAVGLGQPYWYTGGVELVFCAISLTIPTGMYFATRYHFGETAARVALCAGALWYELCGFAHKPMTEFVATGPLLLALWIAVRPGPIALGSGLCAALLAVVATAVRLQYAPVAAVLFIIVLLRTQHRPALLLAAPAMVLAVGALDAAVWDRGLFHSYVTNVRFNLAMGEQLTGESPPWQYLAWLFTAHAGLSAVCVLAAAFAPRRYALLLVLVAVILVIHSIQPHKEYRFVFATVPLLMMIGADLAVRLHGCGTTGRAVAAAVAAAFSCVSAGGILNALPYQDRVYKAWSRETGQVVFLGARDVQDPVFAAYRWLANAPGVEAVWHADRRYYNTPGYYHLHRDVPLYDRSTGGPMASNPAFARAMVTHIVTGEPDARYPGFTEQRTFGSARVLARRAGAPVPSWQQHVPVLVSHRVAAIFERIDPDAPTPPPLAGIRFEDGGLAPPKRERLREDPGHLAPP